MGKRRCVDCSGAGETMHNPIEYFVCYQTHDSLQIGPTSTKVTPELGSLRRCGENVKVPLHYGSAYKSQRRGMCNDPPDPHIAGIGAVHFSVLRPRQPNDGSLWLYDRICRQWRSKHLHRPVRQHARLDRRQIHQHLQRRLRRKHRYHRQ
jgi:hypothetical protein